MHVLEIGPSSLKYVLECGKHSLQTARFDSRHRRSIAAHCRSNSRAKRVLCAAIAQHCVASCMYAYVCACACQERNIPVGARSHWRSSSGGAAPCARQAHFSQSAAAEEAYTYCCKAGKYDHHVHALQGGACTQTMARGAECVRPASCRRPLFLGRLSCAPALLRHGRFSVSAAITLLRFTNCVRKTPFCAIYLPLVSRRERCASCVQLKSVCS